MSILRSIRIKFAIPISFLLVLIFLGQTLINIRAIERRLIGDINSEVKSFSQLSTRSLVETYERYYPSGFHKFKEVVEDTWKLSPNTNRIQLVDMEGKILFDTKDLKMKELKELEVVDSPTLEKIRKPDPSYTYKDEKKNILDEIIFPYIDEWGRHQYSLIYLISYEIVKEETFRAIMRSIFLTVILLILSVALVSLLTFRITKPLSELEKGVRVIGAGNLEYKLKIKTGDEIEQLADEFNKMTEKLKESKETLEAKVKERTRELEEAKGSLEVKIEARTKELKELSESLEKKVEERTKELNERLEELERFHTVTVGRELKMMEVKEKIKKLEKELEKYKGRQI